jgi:DNA topoisomerase-1
VLGTDPQSGKTIVAKDGRYGPYVTEQLEEGSSAKPRTASLLKSMDLDSVTLEDALRLLTLPRTLGEIDGEPVTVQNGRYGPYVKKGTDSRSLETEEQMFTVTLDEARELFAQPKTRGRAAGGAAAPLRELGEDTASGKPILLKEGRFGPYVTDGETNASLRKGDAVESITNQRAVELLAERRAAAPSPRRRASASSRSTGSRGTGRATKAKPKAAPKDGGSS